MEHLFYFADSIEETKSASINSILAGCWDSDLPAVGYPDFAEPRTPWLGFQHDEIPLTQFSDYPKAAGFITHKIWSGLLRDAHPSFTDIPGCDIGQAVVSFLQSWLFFGHIESFVGKKIKTSYLTRQHTDGFTYLYTRNLHFCLQATVFRMRTCASSPPEMSAEIQARAHIVNQWTTRFELMGHSSFRSNLDANYPNFTEQLGEVVPAIVRLAEAIEMTRIKSFPSCPTIGTLSWRYPCSITEKRKARLLDLGWCKFQVRFLEDTLSQSTIDWIDVSQLAQDPVGHEKCSESACARSNIDESTYTQSHCCPGRDCDKLKPDLELVASILQGGMVPVMSLRRSHHALELVVQSASRTVEGTYIAFSHVWADGLGGATETGLNRCQAERLDELCRLYDPAGDGLFWLDSLCIPSKKAVGADIYIKALVAIRDVYLNAYDVLAIDKTILRCTKESSTEYLYAHVYLSAWMQRMWTYEESVLAKNLVFVLKDSLHTYSVTTKSSMRSTVSIVWQSLAAQIFRLRASPRINMGHVSRAFRHRLTNVVGEEFISVSGMLNLDTAQLLDIEGEQRTARFWLLLGNIPCDAPFLCCPKLSLDGFRWAPHTLMSPSPTTLDTAYDGPQARCTAQGLVGSYLVIDLLNSTLQGSNSQSGSVFNIWIRGSHGAGSLPDYENAFLRVYCVESWPRSPEKHEFNTIYVSDSATTFLKPGQWITGAAAERLPCVGNMKRFRQIERVLVERLQNDELAMESRSIFFLGSQNTSIDAEGVCILETICIA